MSADLATTATHATDPALVGRIKAAMSETAVKVLSETGVEVASHAVRARLAQQVMRDPETAKATFVQLVCDSAAVSSQANTAAVPDADIRAVLTSTWSRVAAELGF